MIAVSRVTDRAILAMVELLNSGSACEFGIAMLAIVAKEPAVRVEGVYVLLPTPINRHVPEFLADRDLVGVHSFVRVQDLAPKFNPDAIVCSGSFAVTGVTATTPRIWCSATVTCSEPPR
jgi:hypothetical protein